MRFSAPKAPKFFRDLEINKNPPPPLLMTIWQQGGGIFIKNSTDSFYTDFAHSREKSYFERKPLKHWITVSRTNCGPGDGSQFDLLFLRCAGIIPGARMLEVIRYEFLFKIWTYRFTKSPLWASTELGWALVSSPLPVSSNFPFLYLEPGTSEFLVSRARNSDHPPTPGGGV